jgi:hypothetical protein
MSVLMMGAAGTSETSVNFFQITWHYNPVDSHVQSVQQKSSA